MIEAQILIKNIIRDELRNNNDLRKIRNNFRYVFSTQRKIKSRLQIINKKDVREKIFSDVKVDMRKFIRNCFKDKYAKNIRDEDIDTLLARVRDRLNEKSKDEIMYFFLRNVTEKFGSTVERSAKQKFNIKTSEYGFYVEPPMGYNQFLNRITDENIFECVKEKDI